MPVQFRGTSPIHLSAERSQDRVSRMERAPRLLPTLRDAYALLSARRSTRAASGRCRRSIARRAASETAAPTPARAGACALRGRVCGPGHQQRQRKPRRRSSSCSPRAASDTFGTGTGVTPSCVGPGAQLGRRGHEILAADQRPVGMDRAALVLEERAGHAQREVGDREFAVAAGPLRARAQPGRRSIAASAAAKRARTRLAPLRAASPRPAQQPLALGARDRHELAAAGAAALAAGDRLARPPPRATTAFTSPCRAGTTSASPAPARVRHGDRMGDPEIADGEAQSGGGVAGIGHEPRVPRSGLGRRAHATRPHHGKRQRHPSHIPRILPHATATRSWPRARSCRATTRR